MCADFLTLADTAFALLETVLRVVKANAEAQAKKELLRDRLVRWTPMFVLIDASQLSFDDWLEKNDDYFVNFANEELRANNGSKWIKKDISQSNIAAKDALVNSFKEKIEPFGNLLAGTAAHIERILGGTSHLAYGGTLNGFSREFFANSFDNALTRIDFLIEDALKFFSLAQSFGGEPSLLYKLAAGDIKKRSLKIAKVSSISARGQSNNSPAAEPIANTVRADMNKVNAMLDGMGFLRVATVWYAKEEKSGNDRFFIHDFCDWHELTKVTFDGTDFAGERLSSFPGVRQGMRRRNAAPNVLAAQKSFNETVKKAAPNASIIWYRQSEEVEKLKKDFKKYQAKKRKITASQDPSKLLNADKVDKKMEALKEAIKEAEDKKEESEQALMPKTSLTKNATKKGRSCQKS